MILIIFWDSHAFFIKTLKINIKTFEFFTFNPIFPLFTLRHAVGILSGQNEFYCYMLEDSIRKISKIVCCLLFKKLLKQK